MLDYQSLIDRRIAELQDQINKSRQFMESRIEAAMGEFIFQQACKSNSIPAPVNVKNILVEGEAKRYVENIVELKSKIKALQSFKENLDKPEVKGLLDTELNRFVSLTFPEEILPE